MSLFVLQVLPSLAQGGVERGTIEIATALKQEGIQNAVVSEGGKMVAELEALGVEHITLPVKSKNPFVMWLNARRLAKILKEKQVSVVHVRSRAPAWSVKWACQQTGVPFIATFHGAYGTKPAWLKKAYNRVMVQGKLVIAVSAFIRQHIMKEYHVPEQHIRLIYRGADIDKFDPKQVSVADINEFIKEYNIPTDKPIITLVGRLSKIKGHSVVLNALRQMKHKKVTCLFLGGKAKPKYMEVLERELKQLSPETQVRIFSVPGSKMPIALSVSDVVVQPTLVPESFGRGIAEAQAMGKIVVASNHGGAVELISNGRTGFLTPVGDADVLAHVLDQVLDMPKSERQKIEEESMASVRNNFSIKKMCDRTIQTYREFDKRV